MTQVQRILKNVVVGVGSGAIAGVVDLVVVVVLARYLGVAGFGTYAFVMAFVRLLQHVGDLGLRTILLREIASNRRDIEHVQKTLGTARALVWLLSAATFLLMAGLIHLLTSDAEVIRLTYLAGLALITILHANAYGAVCRAFEDMEYNAIGYVLERVLFVVLMLSVVLLDWGLRGVFASLLLANLLLWGYLYVVVRVRYVRPRIWIDPAAWWAMAKEAVPVGIGVIARRASWQVDTVLLVQMADVIGAGLFSAAYKIPMALSNLSLFLSHPFAPVYAKLAKDSPETLSWTCRQSLKGLWVLSVPIAVGIVMFAEPIVGTVYGEQFAPAAPALQILSIAALFLFPTSQYIGLFAALGQQRLYMRLAGACLAVNVIFDLLLIPRYSFIGASVATALAEMTFFSVGLYFLRRLDLRVPLFRVFALPLAAGAILGVFSYQLRGVPLVWVVVGGGVGLLLYGALLLLFGVLTIDELASIWQRLSPGRAAVPRPAKPIEG